MTTVISRYIFDLPNTRIKSGFVYLNLKTCLNYTPYFFWRRTVFLQCDSLLRLCETWQRKQTKLLVARIITHLLYLAKHKPSRKRVIWLLRIPPTYRIDLVNNSRQHQNKVVWDSIRQSVFRYVLVMLHVIPRHCDQLTTRISASPLISPPFS